MWWVALATIGAILLGILTFLFRNWERLVAGSIGAFLAWLFYSTMFATVSMPFPMTAAQQGMFQVIATGVGFMIGWSMGSGWITGISNDDRNRRR